MTTWVLTGSPENYAATRSHGYGVIGLKERNRTRAERIEPGDPWHFPTELELMVDEDAWIDAEPLADELEHVAKWPREHWTLAFQGQIRPVSEHDAAVLVERLRAAAPVPS